MQLVDPRLRSSNGFVKKLAQVNFKGELVSVVDLHVTRSAKQLLRADVTTDLDHSVPLDIVFESFKL